MQHATVHVRWLGYWLHLMPHDDDIHETTFIEANGYGSTHVLDIHSGVWRFNGTTDFLILYSNVHENDLGFLASILRIRLEYPMRGHFVRQYDRISDLIIDNNAETYEFTVAVRLVTLVSRVLQDGDHAIARRVLGCLFAV